MTTYKGIAAVTQTLGYLAGAAVLDAVPEARVTLTRPEESPAGSANEPRLNVYLVQVLPEPTMRSNDLPMRDGQGNLVSVPQAPVNLRYLLSFFGPSEKAHLMLGAVEVVLRARAVLDPTLISQALASHPELADSGLEAQVPPVRIVPSIVSLEDLARFWSGFLQMPYTVSTVYEAMTVVLSSTATTVAALPVRQVGGAAGAMPPQLDPLPTVQFSSTGSGTVVPVTGSRLAAGQLVQLAGAWMPLSPAANGFQFSLPPNVPAGAQTVRLGTALPATTGSTATTGSPTTTRSGSTLAAAGQPIPGSDPQVLRVRPELVQATADSVGQTVTIEIAPPVAAGQSVVLSLVGISPGIDPTTDSAQVLLTPSITSSSLSFPVPSGFGAGQYLTIVEVDGVSTLPTVVGGVYAQPAVSLP